MKTYVCLEICMLVSIVTSFLTDKNWKQRQCLDCWADKLQTHTVTSSSALRRIGPLDADKTLQYREQSSGWRGGGSTAEENKATLGEW